MYNFRYDKDKNRIYIYIVGTISEAELENYKRELLEIVNNTSYGFTVFGDSSKGSIEFLKNSGKLQFIRDYAVTRGFKGVATILSPEASEMHKKEAFPGIKNVFTDPIEAEKFLDNLK